MPSAAGGSGSTISVDVVPEGSVAETTLWLGIDLGTYGSLPKVFPVVSDTKVDFKDLKFVVSLIKGLPNLLSLPLTIY
jgi:hypothetical protein